MAITSLKHTVRVAGGFGWRPSPSSVAGVSMPDAAGKGLTWVRGAGLGGHVIQIVLGISVKLSCAVLSDVG